MRLEGELYGIHIGTFVMNCHHGLVRMGVVREKRIDDDGWAYCQVDWLEDELHTAKIAWDKKMGAQNLPSHEIRVDWLTPISPQWLQNVMAAYGEYENERRTEFS